MAATDMDPGRREAATPAFAPRILLIDDDATVRRVVGEALAGAGYEVWPARSAESARERVSEQGLPHLAILDLRMPEGDGVELARELHRWSDLPIIVVTGHGDRRTRVEAIEEFAEDFVVKPFDPDELVARVGRVLRRLGDFRYTLGPILRIDQHLQVDFARRRVVLDGEEVALTPTESKILHLLLAQGGRTVATSFLVGRLWPQGGGGEDVLRVHVHRLRQKLGRRGRHYLRTQRGRGYSFVPPSS